MQDFCTLERLVNSILEEYKEFRMSKGKKVLIISIIVPRNNHLTPFSSAILIPFGDGICTGA